MVDELRPNSMWVKVAEAAHAKLAPLIDARKRDHVADILETFERDLAPLLAPMVRDVIDHPDTPASVRTFLAPLLEPEHFSESIVISFAIGAMMSPILGSAIAPIVQTIANNAWSQSVSGVLHGGTVPPTPDLLAAAVIKGVISEGAGATRAAESGTSASDFQLLANTAGQSIGTEEALLLLRRGQIDDTEFHRIMHYSNVRDDFIPDALLLKYSPPPAGEVIAGALKGHLADADATKKLGEAGIDPTNYKWMKDSAGRPPGIDQMLHLWNRGVATQADVEAAVRQSDINDNFLPFVEELRHYFPPPRSVVPMLRSGAITEAEARTLLGYYGVGEPWASAFVTEAHTTSTSAAKELSMSQVVNMYRDRFITSAEATTRLAALKFPSDQITLLLGYADDLRTVKLTNALIAQVGALYTAHKLTKPNATVALNGGKVTAAVQTDLFTIWDLERTAKVHHPTSAQIVGAYRRKEITAAECKTRLQALGVADSDLGVIVADGWPPTKPAEAQAAATAVVNA